MVKGMMMKMFNKDERSLSHYYQLLEQEKKKTLSLMTKEGFTLRESLGELSVVDNHPADTGSELFERSKDMTLYDRHVKKLEQIDEALQRMAEGNYGNCLSCGASIPGQRLEAVPYARYCVGCQQLLENESREKEGDDRPVEELPLSTPFARTFACQRGADECEGEDAWQDVAAYGTADSLQDSPEENSPEENN